MHAAILGLGFCGFILGVTLICVVAYWNAESLENWTKKHIKSHTPTKK